MTTQRATEAAAAAWTLLRKGAAHPLTRMAAAALLQSLATHVTRTPPSAPGPKACGC